MITFTFRPRGADMRADWSRFTRVMGTLTESILMQEGCLTARAALKYAPPIVPTGGKGDTAVAGKTGERAIDKDVRAIFAAPGSTLPAVFAKGGLSGTRAAFTAWRKKPFVTSSSTLLTKIYYDADPERAYQKAKNIFANKPSKSTAISNIGQMQIIHNSQRKNGRVVREGRPSKEIKRYPYIAKESMIKQYVKRRSLQVGKLKSGWWEIISKHGAGLVIFGRTVDAGAKGLPKYITRHGGNGVLEKQFGLNRPIKKVVITNRIGDNDGAGLRTKTFALVIAHRNAAIAKRPYQQYADKLVRNWNRKGTMPEAS